MKTIPDNYTECEELKNLRKELNLPPVNTDLWLSLPRVFTRSSARFELPMDSRTLSCNTHNEQKKLLQQLFCRYLADGLHQRQCERDKCTETPIWLRFQKISL